MVTAVLVARIVPEVLPYLISNVNVSDSAEPSAIGRISIVPEPLVRANEPESVAGLKSAALTPPDVLIVQYSVPPLPVESVTVKVTIFPSVIFVVLGVT